MRISGPYRSILASVLLVATLGCARESVPRGPQRLVERAAEGGPARVAEIEVKGQKRRALVASARYRLPIPREALLVLSLAAPMAAGELRGFLHLRVRVDGREVGERRINVRTERDLRATYLAFEGPDRVGLLELDLGLFHGSGEPLPVPEGLTLAVVDPVLVDVSARNDRQGVVLISIDTLRRDHVGLYGYAKPTTPNLDALGHEGLVCDDAVSVSSWTLPAHFSMMTSVEPAAHGAVHADLAFNHRVPTLARTLREAGFATHAVTSHLYVSPEYGFNDGFDDLDYRYDRKGLEVANAALAFLDEVDRRPFFLFLHFYDPHWHYAPPPEALRAFEPEPYQGRMDGNWWRLKHWKKETTSPADLAHLLALYDGEIRYTDGQVQRVLRRLREKGLEGRTLVVVTSDHGEEFLEHASWEHQRTLYEEVLQIPLLFQGPGIPRNRRLSEQVSLLDVTPTILDWVGLPPLPTQRGRSLLQSVPEREAYGETDHGLLDTRKLFLRGGAGSWKAILTFDRKTGAPVTEEWYDLRTDPGESGGQPVPANAGAIRSRLLQRWQDASRQGAGGVPVDLSPEQIEQLRALGYLQ